MIHSKAPRALDLNKELSEFREAADTFIKSVRDAPYNVAAIFPAMSQPEIREWFERIVYSSTSIYDRAMDANYLEDYIGGGTHRIVDGGHDLFNAWNKVRDASATDTFGAEVTGYVQAILNDASTPAGMPYVTWSKNTYDQVSDWFVSAFPGTSKQWFQDIITYDVAEVASCAIGAVGALMCLKTRDEEMMSELLGSTGIVSVWSGNPLMLIITIVAGAIAYKKGMRTQSGEMATGAILSGISMALFQALSLPFLIELVMVLVVLALARKGIRAIRRHLRPIFSPQPEYFQGNPILALPPPAG